MKPRKTMIALALISLLVLSWTGWRAIQGLKQRYAIGDLVQIPGCRVMYDGPKDLPLQRYEKEGWPWLGQDLYGRCGTAIIPLHKAEQAIEPLKRLPFLRQLVIHSQSDETTYNEIILRTLRKELELERIQMKIDLSL